MMSIFSESVSPSKGLGDSSCFSASSNSSAILRGHQLYRIVLNIGKSLGAQLVDLTAHVSLNTRAILLDQINDGVEYIGKVCHDLPFSVRAGPCLAVVATWHGLAPVVYQPNG